MTGYDIGCQFFQRMIFGSDFIPPEIVAHIRGIAGNILSGSHQIRMTGIITAAKPWGIKTGNTIYYLVSCIVWGKTILHGENQVQFFRQRKKCFQTFGCGIIAQSDQLFQVLRIFGVRRRFQMQGIGACPQSGRDAHTFLMSSNLFPAESLIGRVDAIAVSVRCMCIDDLQSATTGFFRKIFFGNIPLMELLQQLPRQRQAVSPVLSQFPHKGFMRIDGKFVPIEKIRQFRLCFHFVRHFSSPKKQLQFFLADILFCCTQWCQVGFLKKNVFFGGFVENRGNFTSRNRKPFFSAHFAENL